MFWITRFKKASAISAHIAKYPVCFIPSEIIYVQSVIRKQELPLVRACHNKTNSRPGSIGNKYASRLPSYSVLLGIITVPLFSLLFWLHYKTRLTEDDQMDDATFHRDKYCSGNSGTLIKVGKYWLPFEFFKQRDKLKDIKEFQVRDSDIIIASFPKSGTTWVQEITHHITSGSLQLEKQTIEELFPYIEYVYPGLKSLAKSASPRCMKTHLPYELLPDCVHRGHGKVIYIARNIKDVSVSYYHFIKMLTITKYSGEFRDFFRAFTEGKVAYGPWTEHVLEYWKHRKQSNILFITYEELHENPFVVIKQISSFLGKSVDEEQMLEIAYRCSFSQMKSNPLVNYSWWDDLGIRDKNQSAFMRKGKVGDWMNYYTEEMANEINECCTEPVHKQGLILKDTL